MGAVEGALVGAAGLVTLYNVTQTANAAGVGTLFALPGRFAHWLVSPTVPLVPDLRTGGASKDAQGNLSATNGQGDTITQHPDGSVTIGGPNGIPVYPNSYSPQPAGGVQLALAQLSQPTTQTQTA